MRIDHCLILVIGLFTTSLFGSEITDTSSYSIAEIIERSIRYCKIGNVGKSSNEFTPVLDSHTVELLLGKTSDVIAEIIKITNGQKFTSPLIYKYSELFFCDFVEAPIRGKKGWRMGDGAITFKFDNDLYLVEVCWEKLE